MNIDKSTLQKALIAGFFSTITIGVLTVLTYKSTLGYFIAGSFGSSMVLLFGFPESPFAQPKNVFFGHLCTALVVVFEQEFDKIISQLKKSGENINARWGSGLTKKLESKNSNANS